jgi:hypothetical protein
VDRRCHCVPSSECRNSEALAGSMVPTIARDCACICSTGVTGSVGECQLSRGVDSHEEAHGRGWHQYPPTTSHSEPTGSARVGSLGVRRLGQRLMPVGARATLIEFDDGPATHLFDFPEDGAEEGLFTDRVQQRVCKGQSGVPRVSGSRRSVAARSAKRSSPARPEPNPADLCHGPRESSPSMPLRAKLSR